MTSDLKLVAIVGNSSSGSFLTDGFSTKGYSVRLLSDADNAIRHVDEHGADLILFDCRNDVDRTVHWLEVMREHWPMDELPVIVLTSAQECEQIVRFLKAGANDFILKPLTAENVDRRVRGVLAVRDNVTKMLEAERRRVVSEALARASAVTAAAVAPLVDGLEGVMQDQAHGRAVPEQKLNEILEHTEAAVGVIDRLRQIASLEHVPYLACMHLLQELSALHC